ncbi:MAG: hypothetical protein JXM72_00820 [Deltaproteobacteria bacterium]|nr:hypothetical protein [Deltaproteobacteria bacterium]
MIPLIINSPESMYKVRLASLRDDISDTLIDLQSAGMLQVEPAGELTEEEKESIIHRKEQSSAALLRIQDILSGLTSAREVYLPETLPEKPLEDIVSFISDIHEQCTLLIKKHESAEARISDLQSMTQYLQPLATEIDFQFEDLHYTGEYLFTKVLVFSHDSFRHFTEKAGPGLINNISAETDSETVTLIIARTHHRQNIEKLAADLGARELNIPDKDMSVSIFLKEYPSMRDAFLLEAARAQDLLVKTIEDRLEEIVVCREILTAHNSRLSVLEQLSYLNYATVIEGWVPASRADDLSSLLKQSQEYLLVEMTVPTQKDEPPSELRNPSLIRPFQVIVNLFSVPRYGDWDPTPIVAYFFAFFFGLMLNDSIYSLGLLITARFFLDKLVDDPDSPGVHLFRRVLYISGSSGLVFGLLSGVHLGDFPTKYFNISIESVAMVAWVQKKLSDPITFIILALIIGMVHVNIAHILSLIKGVQERKTGIILSKIGLFITEVFGIPYLLRSLLNIDLLSVDAHVYAMFVYPLAIGLLFVIIGSFMQMGFLGALFWIFDLTGILGDVMSYSRLAGVGLATYYLASSFNLLSSWFSSIIAGVIPGVAGVIAAFIVGTVLLIALHTFNMLLSSLAAFIHSLRLCFVEFLMKFYEGGGREYSPFHAQLRKKVVVGIRS